MIQILVALLSASSCRIAADFTLSTVTADKGRMNMEVVRGKLYICYEPIVIFDVCEPLNQIMWIKPDTTDIYYPDENKLFRLLTNDSLPTQKTTIPQILDFDYERNLHRAGFKVNKSENKGDTLLLYWYHPKYTNLPKVITGSIDESFVLYRTSGKGWSIEFQLRGYEELNGKLIPHHLRSIVKKGKFLRTEELRLENIKTNTPLSSRLSNYKIPKDAETKVIDW